VDSGALFFAQPRLAPSRLEPAKVTARGIALAMAAMRAAAIGVSPYDLAAGTDFLKQLASENNLSLLSANLVKDNKPVFPPFRITKRGSTRIALVGLTGPLHGEMDSIALRPWQDVLPALLAEVEKKSDMVILLSSMPHKVNQQIATQFKNIHIILQSGQRGSNQPPKNINNTLLCQTAPQGKYLGILDISWNSTKEWQKVRLQDPDVLQRRLDRILWQLERMKKRYPERELAANSQYKRLEREKRQLEKTLQKLREAAPKNRQSPCQYNNVFIAIETSLPEDREIRALVDKIRREVNQVNRKLQEQQRRTNTRVLQTFSGMASSQRCKECHPKQAAFYLRTDHARAWQTLARRDQHYNPDCIACHATLPEYNAQTLADEALLTALPSRFHNVGCEACHGPALAHANTPDNVLPKKPQETTCRQCHTPKRDPHFKFQEKKMKIQCPAG